MWRPFLLARSLVRAEAWGGFGDRGAVARLLPAWRRYRSDLAAGQEVQASTGGSLPLLRSRNTDESSERTRPPLRAEASR